MKFCRDYNPYNIIFLWFKWLIVLNRHVFSVCMKELLPHNCSCSPVNTVDGVMVTFYQGLVFKAAVLSCLRFCFDFFCCSCLPPPPLTMNDGTYPRYAPWPCLKWLHSSLGKPLFLFKGIVSICCNDRIMASHLVLHPHLLALTHLLHTYTCVHTDTLNRPKTKQTHKFLWLRG